MTHDGTTFWYNHVRATPLYYVISWNVSLKKWFGGNSIWEKKEGTYCTFMPKRSDGSSDISNISFRIELKELN